MKLINKDDLEDRLKYMSEIKVEQLEVILDRIPTIDVSEVSGYAVWLERMYVESEMSTLCEDMADEWCEKNCEFTSIQPICLWHIYQTYIRGKE